jgi:hypothetical protein
VIPVAIAPEAHQAGQKLLDDKVPSDYLWHVSQVSHLPVFYREDSGARLAT